MLAAVNTVVISAPRIRPRIVSSLGFMEANLRLSGATAYLRDGIPRMRRAMMLGGIALARWSSTGPPTTISRPHLPDPGRVVDHANPTADGDLAWRQASLA